MPTITVLEKLYGSGSPATFERFYANLISGLKIQLSFAGTTKRGWIQLNISGEDETAALSFLEQNVGLAPICCDTIKKFSIFQGRVIFSSKSENELIVDLGFSETCDATVSKKQLCTQLADGKETLFRNLVELFCLYDNIPLEVKIAKDVGKQRKTIEAIFSEQQIKLFRGWINSRFDRLIILGALFSEVENAMKKSRISRDIIRTESLGLLEQVVLCKLGTDAVGLIPKLGRYIKSAVLVPFSPKKILDTFGSQTFDIRI